MDKDKMPFLEPFSTDCEPCHAPDCPHTKQCIIRLRGENKDLKERIEMAVSYLPESPDKAKGFLIPVLVNKRKGGEPQSSRVPGRIKD